MDGVCGRISRLYVKLRAVSTGSQRSACVSARQPRIGTRPQKGVRMTLSGTINKPRKRPKSSSKKPKKKRCRSIKSNSTNKRVVMRHSVTKRCARMQLSVDYAKRN